MSAPDVPPRILAVTDLGAAGAAAVSAGAARARALGATFAVVHVMPPLDAIHAVFPQQLADEAVRNAALPQQIRDALDRHLAAAAPDGPPAEVFLEAGGNAEVALRIADEWACDLVVVGAADDGVVDAERVVRHARVPVLVVRAGPTEGAVVACTDFSDPALPAVHAAAEEAKRTGDRLYVVHALAPLPMAMLGVEGYGIMAGSEWQQARRDAAERQLQQALAGLEVTGEYVAVDGPVVSTLVAAARERDARLMVIGTVGRTGLTRFLLGSVAEALVRTAPCSTLVVRIRRGDARPPEDA